MARLRRAPGACGAVFGVGSGPLHRCRSRCDSPSARSSTGEPAGPWRVCRPWKAPDAARPIVPRCWVDWTGTVEPRSGGVRHLTLTRRGPRRRPGLQAEVCEDPLDHRRFENGRDDLDLPTAVRAVLHINLESEASAKTNLYPGYVAAKDRPFFHHRDPPPRRAAQASPAPSLTCRDVWAWTLSLKALKAMRRVSSSVPTGAI